MEGKYSLIIMTDSGKTVRWRLGPTMLRTLVVVLVLLPLLAAGSLWLNWKLFTDRRAVLAENATLRHDVDSNAQTVARLSGLERFLMQNAPDSLGDLVAVTPDPAPSAGNLTPDATPTTSIASTASTAGNADSASPTPPTASTPSSENSAAGNSSDNTAASVPPSAPVTPTTSAVALSEPNSPPVPAVSPDSNSIDATAQNQEASSNKDGALDKAEETASPSPTSDENGAAGSVVDKGFARVENLTARRTSSRSLRVSFDLFNTEQVQQLAGKTAFELITKTGEAYPLDAHGDTTFRINRLKKIVGNPTLPADVDNLTGASIRVSIYAGDDLIYRVSTPIR